MSCARPEVPSRTTSDGIPRTWQSQVEGLEVWILRSRGRIHPIDVLAVMCNKYFKESPYLSFLFYSKKSTESMKASWTHWTLSQKHLVGHPQHLFLRWSKGQSPGERTAHSPYAPGFDFCFACCIWLEQWFTFQGHQVYKTSLKRFFIQDPSECTLPKGYGVSRTRRNRRCPHNQGISA